MTNGALQVVTHWAYKYESMSAAFYTPFLPFAIFSQTFISCSLALARFSIFLSFGLKTHFHRVWEKMTEETKLTAEAKVAEETKLFEEKKAVNPYIAGFIESMSKTNKEKITKEILEGLSEDTSDSDSYDVESGDEDLKIGPGGQAMLSSENRPLNRVILRT
jgi:hypothetical protein